MYPYTPQGSTTPSPATICYDSSPKFGEDPAMVLCTGDTVNYNHNAYDEQLDPLVYKVGIPLGNYSSFGTWTFDPNAPAARQNPTPLFPAAGYPAGNLYLPDVTIDPNNVPATLDSVTGEIVVTNHTAGSFISVIKVESYRCGQLIAVVYRDLQIVYLNNCPVNDPPEATIFAPGWTQVNPYLFKDTIVAGDMVTFDLSAVDNDTLPAAEEYPDVLNPLPSKLQDCSLVMVFLMRTWDVQNLLAQL